MKILVTNDDGVYAPGILALAQAMSDLGEVQVIAPDRNRSGASNSLTLDNPVRIKRLDNGFISVEGTPTDCVHCALTGYLDYDPDIVVSGINEGANLGDDVLYSGTVAAAMEGRFLGLPAFAFSLAGHGGDDYTAAAEIAKRMVAHIVDHPLAANTLLNVNIPDVSPEEIKGFEIVRLGNRHRGESLQEATDPRGHQVFWLGKAGPEQDSGPGTDFHAVANGFVSITPLQTDLTHYQGFEKVSQWMGDLPL